MVWSHWICDTRTGVKLAQVFPSSHSWNTKLNSVGSGRTSVQLKAREWKWSRYSNRDFFMRPWARTIVTCWDDKPVYAGVLQTWNWDEDSGVMGFEHRELRAIFTKRFPWTVPTFPDLRNWTFSVAGKSLRGIIRAIFVRGAFSVPGDEWHLPLVYPADEAGSSSRAWPSANFVSVEDMLTEVQETEWGPDIDLRPRWSSAGTLEWELRIGGHKLTGGGTVEWNRGASKSDSLNIGSRGDGTDQLTGVFALGEGSGADMKVGLAGLMPGSDVPNMDAKRLFKSRKLLSSLNADAKSELQAFREPTEQLPVSGRADYVLPRLALGGLVRVWMDGSPVFEDGWMEKYTIGMSGDLSDWVSLEVV